MAQEKLMEEGKALKDGEIDDKQMTTRKEEVGVQDVGQSLQKTKRVATLDVFRGLTIVIMILVDDAGDAYARITHAPRNGCNLADFVMPLFLFIVGVAIALALKLKHLCDYLLGTPLWFLALIFPWWRWISVALDSVPT